MKLFLSKQTFRILVFLLVLVFIGIFISTTDLQKLALSLQKVGYGFIVLILTTFVAYLLGAISWKYCIGTQGRLTSVSNLFVVRHIGETVGMVNPAGIVGAEAVKLYLLQHKGIEKKTILTSILLSRAIMVISQLTLFVVLLMILLALGVNLSIGAPHFSSILLIIFFVILLTALLLAGNRSIQRSLLQTKPGLFVTRKLEPVAVKLKAVRDEFIISFRENKKGLLLSFLFCCLHWIVGGLEFYFILLFLGVPVNPGQALLVDMGVIFFKAAGAFVPGQIGVEEYGNKTMLALVGVHDEEVWISASVLRRARQLFWIAFGGYLYFFVYKKRSSSLQY